ncbi:TIMELESS-interacting protein [Sarotherodon galilaeus]
MEGGELRPGRMQSFSKLPVWIIEHVWTHKMMDIQQVLDPSSWPDVDSQPLSLEDSWRLRVVSAQVYSIVKSRDLEHFERVMGFLETTYRLLPRLVPAIKHMKIMFGIKTMVIMWMLKEGRGMVDTVSKIGQFFPSKLPEYQDQCSQREMFLMRKNHLDFRTLAQTLAMDKDKLEHYIKNEMEEQYGERYAQKVEDRLLHYLHELDAVLQGDTYIDKILKKQSPVTEEEKLLLEVISSDSTTIAATLKKLLHCDAASCRQSSISRSPQLFKSAPYESSSKAPLNSAESQTPPDVHPEEAPCDVSKDGDSFSDRSSDVRGHQQPEEEDEVNKRAEEEDSQGSSTCVQEAASTSQFCSKHQRWVKSILLGCSEELLLQANVSSSPLLFPSSSSTSSSQDLTPSDLIPCPPDQPPLQTPSPPRAAVQASRTAKPKYRRSSGSLGSSGDTSQAQILPQASSAWGSPLPALLSPVVRLVNIGSFETSCKRQHALPKQLLLAASSSSEMLSSPHHHTSGNVKDKNSSSTSARCQTPTEWRKLRRVCSTNRHKEDLEAFTQNPQQLVQDPSASQMGVPATASDISVSGPPQKGAQSESLFSAYAANQITPSSKSSKKVVPRSSLRHRQPQNNSRPRSETAQRSSRSSSAAGRSKTSRGLRAQLRLSLPSQGVLLHSKLLQPYVSLTRLSSEQCHLSTQRTASAGQEELVEQDSDSEERRKEEEEDLDSSFDVNALFSTDSSSSDGEESPDRDPDYRPHIKKKRLLLEYENARVLSHGDGS